VKRLTARRRIPGDPYAKLIFHADVDRREAHYGRNCDHAQPDHRAHASVSLPASATSLRMTSLNDSPGPRMALRRLTTVGSSQTKHSPFELS
jgi:hypothetical protein